MKIPWGKPHFWGKEKQYLNEAFDSTWISGGHFVDLLENQFASLHGYKYGISVANGTCSIFLSLKVLNIGPGDEVLIPGFGFIAALNMVLEVGATPVFCDIEADTMLLDVEDMAKKITSKTKAVIPIHTYGNVCDMELIRALADKHGFAVLEDVAEAIFSKYAGKYAGTFSEISSFSFQTTKTITTGEGGIILTNSDEVNAKLRKLRSHGMGGKKYWHEGVAYNFRLTNLQASLGVAQFEFKDQIIAERKKLYSKFISSFSGLKNIELQKYKSKVDPVVWAFPIVLSEKAKVSRDDLMRILDASGIENRPGFYTPHQLPAYNGPYLEHCEFVAKQTITLPFYVGVSDQEIEYMKNIIEKAL